MAGSKGRNAATVRDKSIEEILEGIGPGVPTASEELVEAEKVLKEAVRKGGGRDNPSDRLTVLKRSGEFAGFKTHDRRRLIRRIKNEVDMKSNLTVDDLCGLFGVSPSTIVKDLKVLREEDSDFVQNITTESVIAELRTAKNRAVEALMRTYQSAGKNPSARVSAQKAIWDVEVSYVDRLARHGFIHVEPNKYVSEVRQLTANVDIPIPEGAEERVSLLRSELTKMFELKKSSRAVRGKRISLASANEDKILEAEVVDEI